MVFGVNGRGEPSWYILREARILFTYFASSILPLNLIWRSRRRAPAICTLLCLGENSLAKDYIWSIFRTALLVGINWILLHQVTVAANDALMGSVAYINIQLSATISMSNLRETLSDLTKGLSEENYDASLAQYRFWLNVGIAHGHINDQLKVAYDANWITRSDQLEQGKPIHPGVRLFARFLKDLEADGTIPGQVSGLKRNCADRMDAFFEDNLSLTRSQPNRQQVNSVLTRTNRIASWANLGYMEEVVLRDRVLQSLISSSKFYDHQADALIVLFRLAGATFEAYVDSSVIDRCFELLKSHGGRGEMVLVSTPSLKG